MWNKDFEISIFNSLEKIPVPYTNECYKAEFDGKLYFVKRVGFRLQESIDEIQARAEITETISAYYNQHGINTIVAVRQNNSYTHVNDAGVWLAYPWSSAQTIDEKMQTSVSEFGNCLHRYIKKVQISTT